MESFKLVTNDKQLTPRCKRGVVPGMLRLTKYMAAEDDDENTDFGMDLIDGEIEYLFNNRAIIDRNKVKLAVFNRIDFPLSSKIYKEIDKAFEQCWNKEIGLGGDIYEGFIEKFIFETLVNKKILIEYSRIEKVVEIMMDYIEMTNGFLDENRNQ
jgi:hypothetical protein